LGSRGEKFIKRLERLLRGDLVVLDEIKSEFWNWKTGDFRERLVKSKAVQY
jgi:hypothetical protein